MPALETRPVQGPLANHLGGPMAADEIVLYWLGQAGFLIETAGHQILIDPYLSDSMGEKYRGTATSYERLMPPPIAVKDLGRVDLVLLTHRHTDHMDPGTLVPLARLRPDLRFVVPRAAWDEALKRTAAAPERLILIDAGERISPLPGLSIAAIRASHETLEVDAEGHHRFLGYGLTFTPPEGPRTTIIHTGDTIPYEGQVAELARLKPDLILAPVNGRSAKHLASGIPGNMTLDEAVAISAEAGALAMVAHHYGMFAINTVPLDTIEAKAADPGSLIRIIPARTDIEFRVRPKYRSDWAEPLSSICPKG